MRKRTPRAYTLEQANEMWRCTSSFSYAANTHMGLQVDRNVDWMTRVPGLRPRKRVEIQVPVEIIRAILAWMLMFHSNRRVFIISPTRWEAFDHIDAIREHTARFPDDIQSSSLRRIQRGCLENDDLTEIRSLVQPGYAARGVSLDSIVLCEPSRFQTNVIREIKDTLDYRVAIGHTYLFIVDSTQEAQI